MPSTPPPNSTNNKAIATATDATTTTITTNTHNTTTTTASPIAAAPLYITIGPPCAGKSTLLREQLQTLDVSLDDQPGVWMPLPLDAFFFVTSDSNNERFDYLNTTVCFGKTLSERIQHASNDELGTVLRCLNGTWTTSQAQEALPETFQTRCLLQAIDEVIQNDAPLKLPATVDLFVVEAIFQSAKNNNTTTPRTNLEQCARLLEQCPLSQPLSWGNTNSKSTDYELALRVAAVHTRPVHFVLYHDPEPPSDVSPQWDCVGNDALQLSSNGYGDLLRRNLRRLIRTGRYVPSTVVWDMRNRTHALLGDAQASWLSLRHKGETRNNNHTVSKLQLDQGLARLANYDMRDNRTVVPLSSPKRRRVVDGDGRWQQSFPGRNHRDNRPPLWKNGERRDPYHSRRPSQERTNGRFHGGHSLYGHHALAAGYSTQNRWQKGHRRPSETTSRPSARRRQDEWDEGQDPRRPYDPRPPQHKGSREG